MESARSTLRVIWQSPAFRLALIAFVVYNANLRPNSSADTYPTRYLPISILRELDFDLDEFPFLQEPLPGIGELESIRVYYLTRSHGHYISIYPVMPAILSLPVYALPVWLGLTDPAGDLGGFNRTEVVATFLAKLSASAAVAISVMFVFWAALELTGARRTALWTAAVYAFATSSWSVSSMGLWQSTMAQALLAVALWALVRAEREARFVGLAGVAIALSVTCRSTNVVYAGFLAAYVLYRHRSWLVRFATGPVLIGALLISYNVYYLGSPIGVIPGAGGEGVPLDRAFARGPSFARFAALLFSPSRGLFASSPILILALVGYARLRRGAHGRLADAVALGSLATLILYATWYHWHGGFGYSYRYLMDLLPGLALLWAGSVEWIRGARWRLGLAGGLAAVSLAVQVIGAFNFPCGWYESPVRASRNVERFWDWGDPQALRCLRAGPVEPEALRLVRDRLGRQES